MSENAELLSRSDEKSMIITLKSWLDRHNIKYENSSSLEELRKLYINAECGS